MGGQELKGGARRADGSLPPPSTRPPTRKKKKMNAIESIAKLVRTSLSNGETIRVTFKKVDGTTAVDRQVTRNMTVIPKDKHPKFVRGENPSYITAFDIKKNDWIRFHQDNLIGCMDFSRNAENMVFAS
jgi:hypothetical protein